MSDIKPEVRVEKMQAQVPDDKAGKRLDQVMAQLFPTFSRSRLQLWIKDGQVLLDGQPCRAKDKLKGGEQIDLTAVYVDQVEIFPQQIDLDVVYEDDDLLVINKLAGLVVHPAAGHPNGTLQNALLHHRAGLSELPRAGIVHRLDKDTSGLLVIACSHVAHKSLVDQLQAHTVKREYRALVMGHMPAGGTVDAPLGRHPVHRKRMAVVPGGKESVTHYHVHERFRQHTLLRVLLETGRTHQIRVHMAEIRHPLVGDQVYAGRLRIPAGISSELADTIRGFKRQALHARFLSLEHPVTGEQMTWEAPLPDDYIALLNAFRREETL